MDSGANAGCSSGDCEEEEQEDPSSSFFNDEMEGKEVSNADTGGDEDLKKSGEEDLFHFHQQWQRELKAPPEGEEKTVDPEPADNETVPEETTAPRGTSQESTTGEDELAAFRAQWQRELEATPVHYDVESKKEAEPTTDEEKAKMYFLRGAELERSGKWYEAIQFYKRAMALIPDIERKLYETTKGTETPQEDTEEIDEVPENTNIDDDDDEEVVVGEEVVARLLRIQARRGMVITPKFDTRATHISDLPYEVLQEVLRWVVSTDLDCMSLERVGATCRAMHIAARDPDLWRAVSVRTWGLECGTPRHHEYPSWRAMYISRPRLQFHGCYISKTTYLRHGENSFQDQFYRPWHLINYYRYLRFFPEGLVLMWTTADEPAACVKELRARYSRPALGILRGHYRLIGDKVVIVIKKNNSEKKQSQGSNTRFRARRKDVELDHTQTSHLELELRSVRGRRNAALSWVGYRVSRRDVWNHFEMTSRAFPPFAFSCVRTYTREATAPL